MQKAIQLKEKYKNMSLSNIAKLEKKSKSQIAGIFRMNNLVLEIQEKILSPTFPHQLKLKDFEKFPKEEGKQPEWFEDLINQNKELKIKKSRVELNYSFNYTESSIL